MSSLSWHRASRASLPVEMIPKPLPTTRDPRIYQIAILSTLLIFGSTFLNFDIALISEWVNSLEPVECD